MLPTGAGIEAVHGVVVLVERVMRRSPQAIQIVVRLGLIVVHFALAAVEIILAVQIAGEREAHKARPTSGIPGTPTGIQSIDRHNGAARK